MPLEQHSCHLESWKTQAGAVDAEQTGIAASSCCHRHHPLHQLALDAALTSQSHIPAFPRLYHEHLLTWDTAEQGLMRSGHLICSPPRQRKDKRQALHSGHACKILLGKALPCLLVQKQITQGISQQTGAAVIKGKLHCLCSARDGIPSHTSEPWHLLICCRRTYTPEG